MGKPGKHHLKEKMEATFVSSRTNQDAVPPGTSPVVQWLRFWASHARGLGLIPCWGTKIPHARNKPKNHHVPPGTEHREGYSMFPMVFLPQMQDLHLNTREFQAILYWGILYQVTGLNLSKTLGPWKTRKNRKLFQTETKVTRQDNQMQSMVLEWIFFPERTWLEWLAKYKGGSRVGW